MADPVTAAVAVGWGMKAVGWLASPIISELFKKGSSILGFDASEKLKELEPKVLLLERVIEVVQESPYRPCLEQLFNNLKSTLYEAQDILDDVEYYHLERQIHDEKFKSADGCVTPRRVDSLMMEKLQSALRSSPLKNEEVTKEVSQERETLQQPLNGTDPCMRGMPSASTITSHPCLAVWPTLVMEAKAAAAVMEGDGILMVDLPSPCDHDDCGL